MIGVTVRRALTIMLVIALTTISLGIFAVPAAAVEGASPAGTFWAWGDNSFGKLGNGTNNDSSDTPVQVSLPNLPSGVTITNIASGEFFSLTLASNGTVWAWGDNTFDELGNGTNTDSNIPVQVSLPSGVTITNIAAGAEFSLALASNGTVWAWGDNTFDELGNGTNTNSNIPVQVSLPNGVTITNIAGGVSYSLALASNGTVWAWGDNTAGELGNGTNTDSNIPVQVSLPSGVTITNIACGVFFGLALASNGAVWAWGNNYYGQLGNGTNVFDSNIPVQVSLPSGVTITNIAAGSEDNLALASNGTVWAWGDNSCGELGNGTNTSSDTPVQVALPSRVAITNIAEGFLDSLALASNGMVWDWGYNYYGQLGNGTNTSSNIPVQVSLPSGVTITKIAGGEPLLNAGACQSLALASNGTVLAWGDNSCGELGNGTNTNSDIPVEVSLPSGVTCTSIAAGDDESFAIGVPMAAPAVTSISPSSGPMGGGTSVTITGSGFVSGATVTNGGAAATGVTFVNSTSITAITPAGTAGAQNVVVTNPDSQFDTLTGGFTYGAEIEGTTYEANGAILGGVTLTPDGTTQITSAADGTYELVVTTTGSHTVVAAEASYRSQTQTVDITDLTATYPLDFKGDNGSVPDAPNVSFVLACINKWKYPPTDGTGLDISKVLSIINAWKFPIN